MPCRFIVRETVTALMHEQLGPYGWGGPLEPHAVGPVRLQYPAATRYNGNWRDKRKEMVGVLSLAASYYPLCLPAFPSFHFKRRAFIGWQM